MVITVPTALGVGIAGIFYGLAKSRKYNGLNVRSKDR